jgi:phospholipase C
LGLCQFKGSQKARQHNGTVVSSTQDHPIDGVFIQAQKSCCRPDTDTFCRVVDDRTNRLGGQVHSKQRAALRTRKTLTASSAVQKVA